MVGTSHDIVFFGTEDFSLITLRALVEANFPVRLVITKPDTLRGRHKVLTEPAVKIYAIEHSIPVLQPQKMRDIIDTVNTLINPTGVLVSFGKIIPQSVINLFQPGIINLHPSLLPRYRGPSPIESAIANGDHETGLSIMQLSAAMDAGPVYYQETIPLSGTEIQTALYETLGDRGAARMVEQLPNIIDESLIATPQDDTKATYCQLLSSADALLDPTIVTAAEFERHIRAYGTFPRTKLVWNSETIIVTKAHCTQQQKTPLDIKCRDSAFLSIDELIAPSGKTMSAAAFLNGYAAG